MQEFVYAKAPTGLTRDEIRLSLVKSLAGRTLLNVLIIPPDFTRYHSNAGLITNQYYHMLTEQGCTVDILPALGTHTPVTAEQAAAMFGDIPFQTFLPHQWREDLVTLGTIPGGFISGITDGLWKEPISAQINKRIMNPRYDLILSVGQVVPHEVIGMANHAKNLFIGVGGVDMINKTHMIGAVFGMERVMGKDHTPVRRILDYAMERFLKQRPILFVLTVCTAHNNDIHTHGLFISEDRSCLNAAIRLSQEKNIDFVTKGLRKCVVYLTPEEYHTTWLGNKAIYRTRMAMADGGELLILAPGIRRFGEDMQVDGLIRKYGYQGRLQTLDAFQNEDNTDLRQNMSAAAHLIHGSSDGRFSITYAVKNIAKDAIEAAGYQAADYDTMIKRYDPNSLSYGYNTLPDGEEIYFIPNPALGLWINQERF